jgi:hypothetical protein
MTSGKSLRLATALATLTAVAAHAADLDTDALLARLARPAPDTTTFVEVRYSALLSEPLVASGSLEHREDGALVRRVTDPYLETTTLYGENVLVEREGSKPRRFSLDRAPELRGMLASFGALIKGDRAQLDRYFRMSAGGSDDAWTIELEPRDPKLARRLANIRVDGEQDRARCFTMTEPDGDGSVMAVGVRVRADLPDSIDRDTLQAWCAGRDAP